MSDKKSSRRKNAERLLDTDVKEIQEWEKKKKKEKKMQDAKKIVSVVIMLQIE